MDCQEICRQMRQISKLGTQGKIGQIRSSEAGLIIGWVNTVNNQEKFTSSNDMQTMTDSVDRTIFPVDIPLTPQVDRFANTTSQLFRPPQSASASLQTSTTSSRSSLNDVQQSRKRAINDSQQGRKWALDMDKSASVTNFTGFETPPLLTSDRYQLAPYRDPFRTPSPEPPFPDARQACFDMSQVDHRGMRGVGRMDGTHFAPSDRPPNSPSIRDGLGNVIYRFAGIAGKVWQNWSTTFKGFYAGGGPGYEVKQIDNGSEARDRWHAARRNGYFQDGCLPLTPGGFPQDDFIPEYMAQDHSKTPIRAAKRNRQSSGSTERWIMVGHTEAEEISPSRISRRKTPRPATSTGKAERQNMNRRSVLGASRYANNGSPRGRLPRASFASPRCTTSAPTSPMRESPISFDVQKHAARIKRKEAEEEAHLKRFNYQLKAMIREGREALGTTFEIEDELDDENACQDVVCANEIG